MNPNELQFNGRYYFTHNQRKMWVKFKGAVNTLHGEKYRFLVTGRRWRGSEWLIPFLSVQQKITVRV